MPRQQWTVHLDRLRGRRQVDLAPVTADQEYRQEQREATQHRDVAHRRVWVG